MRKDDEERKTKREEERIIRQNERKKRKKEEKKGEKKKKRKKEKERRLRWVLYRNVKTHTAGLRCRIHPPPSLLEPRFPEAHKIFEYVECVSKGVGHSS